MPKKFISRPRLLSELNPNFAHKRKGKILSCVICGEKRYYQRTYLKRHKPRTCCTSHAAILKHREGWSPWDYRKRGKYSKRNKSSYRVDALRAYGEKCKICGFDEDVRLLDVDHIDGNHKNDKLSNLQVLCVMCHAKITRGVVKRKGR